MASFGAFGWRIHILTFVLIISASTVLSQTSIGQLSASEVEDALQVGFISLPTHLRLIYTDSH